VLDRRSVGRGERGTSSRAARRALALALGLAVAALILLTWSRTRASDEPDALGFFEPAQRDVARAVEEAEVSIGRTGLRRLRLDEEQAGKIFPLDQPHVRYDPHTWFAYKANLDLTRPWPEPGREGRWPLRTNSLGMREDADPSAARPDLRVLVAGDSHTDGVCPNELSFTNLCEARLRAEHPARAVECLNAGRGGFSFYHYLGTLERFVDLAPDVFVVAVYGGNDFGEAHNLHKYFAGKVGRSGSRAYRQRLRALTAAEPELLGQAALALAHFNEFPGQVERAARTARDVVAEIRALCAERGIELLIVYFPSVLDADPELLGGRLDEVLDVLALDRGALGVESAVADVFFGLVADLGVEIIDLRPEFRASTEPLYWRGEWHINLAGQRLIAARLAPVLEMKLPRDG